MKKVKTGENITGHSSFWHGKVIFRFLPAAAVLKQYMVGAQEKNGLS